MIEGQTVQKSILTAIASYSDKMVDLTSKLVSIPTENPPGANYVECLDILAGELESLDLAYERFELPRQSAGESVNDEMAHFITCTHGDGKPALYFHGHYDVVPANSQRQFKPRRKNATLFGRGSSDMKSGLAAMIYALKAIKESGVELSGRVVLNMVPDEETGGVYGSQLLAKAGLLAQDGIGMLTPEPSSGVVWNASRGALTLRITVKGKPAHVGLHFQGKNAFEGMVAVASRLLELKHQIEKEKTAFNITPEAARQSILLLGGVCAGGSNFNVVPGEMSFTIDRRFNPEEDLETEKKRLFDCLDQLSQEGFNLQVELFQEAAAARCSEDNALARALSQSISEVTGKPARFEMCPGLLEIRFYAAQGVPALAYGPGLLSVSHGPNEFVKTNSIVECAQVYALTALNLLTQDC